MSPILIYDIINKIIVEYLDIDASINLTQVNQLTYYNYYQTRHFYKVFIIKILNYFDSLNNIKYYFHLNTFTTSKLYNIYIVFIKLYYHFKNQNTINLADILIYLSNNSHLKDNVYIFNTIIERCNYSEIQLFNTLGTSDVCYLLKYYKNYSVVFKYMNNIPLEILKDIVEKKTSVTQTNNIIKYTLKNYSRYQTYIDEILTDITCSLIKTNNIISLNYLYVFYTTYKFNLNYQKLFNSCMEQSNSNIIDFINDKMNQRIISNNPNFIISPIIIKKECIRNLMQSKNYKVLDRIIYLYLGSMINMNMYFKEILSLYDPNNKDCANLIIHFNIENKIKLNQSIPMSYL